MNRSAIIDAIRASIEANLAELQTSMKNYETASNLDETDTLDPDDYARQTEEKDMQLRMQVQIDQTRNQLIRLTELAATGHTVAENGAIVTTSSGTYFLGVSFAAVSHDGTDIMGLSPESPAYLAIKGKSTGDTARIGGHDVVISAVA